MPTPSRLRLAVAQTRQGQDPDDHGSVRDAGREIRALMRQAHAAGADLLQLCEATLCFPDKFALSSDPAQLAEADWARFPWPVVDAEILQIRALARELRLWTVLGVQIRPDGIDAGSRPTTSLLAIDPAGQVAARYDERALSRSKARYLYAAGSGPTVIEIHGLRIGFASGLEVLFPSLFSDYEARGVDCVLYSTAGTPDPAESDSLASSARTQALQNQYWIGYAVPSDKAPHTPAGIIAPGGAWAAQAVRQTTPALAVADLATRPPGPGREWRRSMVESLTGP